MTKRDELIALADLRRANVTRQKEWDAFDQLTLAYRGNELAGEVGEACNVIKKLERERLGIKGSRDTVEHLAEELADIIICTDLIAMQAGIDLSSAVIAKFNASSEKVGLKTRLAVRSDAPGGVEAPAAGDGEPVAWIDFAENDNIRLWTSEKRRADAEMALGRKMTPVYTAPPADAGMREALDMVAHSGKFQCFDDDAWDVVNKALTAPGATTKSDGGGQPNATTIAAIEELKRGGGEIGSGYGEYTPVTVRGSTSDPSSTRSEVTVGDFAGWCESNGYFTSVSFTRALLDQFEIRRK